MIGHSVIYLHWLEYIANILSQSGIKSKLSYKELIYPYSLDKNLSGKNPFKILPSLVLNTSYHPELAFMFNKWYLKQINMDDKMINFKVIPDEFKLSPEIFLHWYIGDGGYYIRQGRGNQFNLYTNGFDRKTVIKLQSILNNTIGIKFKIYDRYKEQPRSQKSNDTHC